MGDDILRARLAAAEAYPEYLIDTKGREHPSITRKAIMEGRWDNGSIVRRHLRADMAKEGERP